ncbi:MAG: Crp/Fnr family transcriptional regulator [Proteobacteria bacterium]|nr:Crp/Fnr family transcriptional regulator [Pseudomonadota bacterium]
MFRVTPATCAGCAAGKIGFCANLGDTAIELIAGISRTLRIGKSRIIAREEQAPMSALVLRSGVIKVSHTLFDGRQQIVDFLTTGDVLIQHEGNGKVSVTAEATTDVDACEVSLADLEALCNDTPELAQSMLGAVLCEIGRKNQQVMMLGRKRADERVASFLLDFSERAARRGAPRERLNLPMSRAEIADYLSLTTETVSRAFSLLRAEGIVRLPKPHQVEICDISRLQEIAGGGAHLSVR